MAWSTKGILLAFLAANSTYLKMQLFPPSLRRRFLRDSLTFRPATAPPPWLVRPWPPPNRPSATAAGFLTGSGSGGTSPVAMSTINFASWFESRGRFGFAMLIE